MPNIVAASATNYTLPAISDQPSECIDASWTATSTTGAPDHRYFHTAVWTGSEMIIWGGNGISDDFLRTGGRYNPATDTWTATTTANAPDGRYNHTAVWTGSEMIVWGGIDSSPYLNTGGDIIRHRYLDGHHHGQRTHRTRLSHGSVDWQ
jgi:hypothetical protein